MRFARINVKEEEVEVEVARTAHRAVKAGRRVENTGSTGRCRMDDTRQPRA